MKTSALLTWIGLGLLTAIAIVGIGGGELLSNFRLATANRPDPLPQDALIQVYFNGNQAKGADFSDPDRGFLRPGDDLEAVILQHLNQAESRIDLAVQELRSPRIAQALVAKQQAGIAVRLVLENTYDNTIREAVTQTQDGDRLTSYIAYQDQNKDGQISDEESATRDAIDIVRRGRVPTVNDTADGSKGSGLMHHKFAVIDNKIVLVSSANFTPSGLYGDFTAPETRGNANNLVVIASPQLAQWFTEEFQWLWGDGPGGATNSLFGIQKPRRSPQTLKIGDTVVTVKFSPDSRATPLQNTSNGLIAQTLAQARQKVNLALFVFSEQSLADVLDQRFQAGVTVKALIDRNFAFRPYSEGLDLLGVTRLNQCKPEAGNRPWALPTEFVGVPALPDGDKLHHKMAVIDEQVIITGSHNWSISANVNNDETLLILKNPAIAAHYQREFERLAALSDYGLPASVATIIKREVRDCATAEPAPNPLTTATPSVLVNLNTATLEELTTLPGIGPKLAQKIIDNRPYRSLKDIDNVPGIGPVKLEKLRRRITW